MRQPGRQLDRAGAAPTSAPCAASARADSVAGLPSSSSGSTLFRTSAPTWYFRSSSSSTGSNSASRGGRDLERRDDQEGGLGTAEQLGRRRRARSTNPSYIDLEQDEELGDVLQELRAQDAVGHRVEGLRREADHPGAVRRDEPAQQAGGEEVRHALGRVEEVEGVAGRRGVHDDQVVAARVVDLVQALHRDVVVALDELAGDVLVQRVGQDGVAGGGVGCVQPDQVVPGLLGVEHGRPQLALGSTPAASNARRAPGSRRCRTAPCPARSPAGVPGRR